MIESTWKPHRRAIVSVTQAQVVGPVGIGRPRTSASGRRCHGWDQWPEYDRGRVGGMAHTTLWTRIVIPGPVAPGMSYGRDSSGRIGPSQRSHLMTVPDATSGPGRPWSRTAPRPGKRGRTWCG